MVDRSFSKERYISKKEMYPLQGSSSSAPQPHIQHFTHPHLLHLLFMSVDFNCDGCNTTGNGVRYRCPTCDFDLHQECATSPNSLSSHVHPPHHLILVNRPKNSHFCNVCSGFTHGLSYTCHACNFDAHPLCARIPGVPAFGGCQHGVAHFNQPMNMMMINQQQGRTTSDNISKVGKFAAKFLLDSITGNLSDFSSQN